MQRIILDASVTLSFLLPSQSTTYAQTIFSSYQSWQALVPQLFDIELANVFAGQERRGRLGASETSELLEIVKRLSIVRDTHQDHHRVVKHVLPLAREAKLSVYDACYLELAMKHNIPLATVDEQLAHAARARGLYFAV